MSGAFQPSSVLPSKRGRKPASAEGAAEGSGGPMTPDSDAEQEARMVQRSDRGAIVLMGESDKLTEAESRTVGCSIFYGRAHPSRRSCGSRDPKAGSAG